MALRNSCNSSSGNMAKSWLIIFVLTYRAAAGRVMVVVVPGCANTGWMNGYGMTPSLV